MPALPTVAAYSTIAASSLSSFAGSRQEAIAAERRGNYEASLHRINAQLAEEQAADAIARGHEAEGRHRRGARQMAGAQRARLAAQGIAVDSGSALDIQAETHALSELDALTIRNNAKREAWGFRVDAWNSRVRGQLSQQAGRNEARMARQRGYSTLLTGATQAYDLYRTGR